MSRRVPLSVEGGQGIWTVPQAGGVRIRSVQRGITHVTAAPTDITIAPVDLTKAVIIAQGFRTESNPNIARSMMRLTLPSPSILRFLPWDTASIDGWTQWQVVEFDGLRSLQSGVTGLPFGVSVNNQAISPVNLNRAMLFYTSRGVSADGGSGAWINFWCYGTLTSSTNIQFTKYFGSHYWPDQGDVAWFVVEF